MSLTFGDVISQYESGDLEATKQGCREILRKDAEHVEALSLLSVVEFQTDDYQIALALVNRLIELSPDNKKFFSNRAAILAHMGDIGASIGQCKQLVNENPDSFKAHINLGKAYVMQERWVLAEQSFERARELNSESDLPLVQLAKVAATGKHLQQALAYGLEAERFNPDDTDIQMTLADLYAELGQPDKGLLIWKRLSQQAGISRRQVLRAKSRMLGFQGRVSEAANCCRELLEVNSQDAAAFFLLTSYERVDVNDPLCKEMMETVEGGGVGVAAMSYLGFAFGRIFRNQGDYDASFDFYSRGNEAHLAFKKSTRSKTRLVDTHAVYSVILQQYKKDIAPAGLLSLDTAPDKPVPIFIVGMPRSGSTLAEQILGSHDEVAVAGEMSYFQISLWEWAEGQPGGEDVPLSQKLANCTKLDLERLRDLYFDKLEMHVGDCKYVTDKMLYNFMHLGVIGKILPHAPIINCVRNPMASGLSIFTTRFEDVHHWTHDFQDIAKMFSLHDEIMQFWRGILPGQIFELQYESLVTRPEEEVKTMLKHCGMEFQKQCLEFYKAKNAVRTASLDQVRQPFYTSSVEGWRHFEKQLEPLKVVLSELQKT